MSVIRTDYILQDKGDPVVLESLPCVGSYGYSIRFKSGIAFREGTVITLLCSRKDGTRFSREVEVLDYEEGAVKYEVQDGDFTVGGTYVFQLMQESENSRILSQTFEIGISNSLSEFFSSSSSI